MLFKNEVEDKSIFDMPLPTSKASPNNISMQLRTVRDRRDLGPDDNSCQSDIDDMTKEEYDEMVDALESTTPAGVERDFKRYESDITNTCR